MKTIELSQGKQAIVDDEDYEEVNKYKWCAHKGCRTFYACRTLRINNGIQRKNKYISMHAFLLAPLKKQQIDHKNGNGLDNRKCNIRVCCYADNARNRPKCRGVKGSKYKGVTWNKWRNNFQAQIMVNGKRQFRRSFKSEIDAAKAYDTAAIKYFGEYAQVNFPTVSTDIKCCT